MNPDFSDITALVAREIGRDPSWFYGYDGVPRYNTFRPEECGVYDHFALLVEIACQSCQRRFLVGLGWTNTYETRDFDTMTFSYTHHTLTELAERFGYGDPPCHQCGGDCMSSVALRIVEAWERGDNYRNGLDWQRRPEIEQISVLPEWVTEDPTGEAWLRRAFEGH